MLLGSRLAEYITDMGIEKKALAAVLGVRPTTISAYLSGAGSPTAEGLLRAGELMGVSIDWLLGRNTSSRWSPDILQLRMWLRAKAPEVTTTDAQDRIVQLIRLMQEHVPVCRQDWFMAGVLAMGEPYYKRMLAGEDIGLNDMNLSRFADFTTLPETWLMLGDLELLTVPTDLGDYTNVMLRFVQADIKSEELQQNFNRIGQIIQQMRRLS